MWTDRNVSILFHISILWRTCCLPFHTHTHTYLSHKRSLFPAIYDLCTALKNCCNGPAYDGKWLLEFNGAKSHHIYLSGIDWFSSRQESSGQILGSFSTCKPNRGTSKSKLSWWGKWGREWRSRGWQVYLWQHFIMDDVNISWDRVPLCTVILMKVEIIEPVASYQREPRHCSKTCKSFGRPRQNNLAQRLNSHHGRKEEKRQNKKTCKFILALSVFTDFERWNLSGNSNFLFNRKIDSSRKEISQYYCIEINVNIFLENKYRHK